MDREKHIWDDEFYADLEAKRNARRLGPPTSQQAAEDVFHSGPLDKQCQEVLIRITGRWASGIELSEFSRQYESHLRDLRQRGYKIDTQRSDAGFWYYRLHETE